MRASSSTQNIEHYDMPADAIPPISRALAFISSRGDGLANAAAAAAARHAAGNRPSAHYDASRQPDADFYDAEMKRLLSLLQQQQLESRRRRRAVMTRSHAPLIKIVLCHLRHLMVIAKCPRVLPYVAYEAPRTLALMTSCRHRRQCRILHGKMAYSKNDLDLRATMPSADSRDLITTHAYYYLPSL